MYRTYKNIFRVRAEINSISAGPGQKRIVLPEGWAITTDVAIMFLVSLPLIRFVIAPLPSLLISKYLNLPNSSLFEWIISIIISGFLAGVLSKIEPAGKTSLQYIIGIIGFLMRNKWHDGWQVKRIRLSEEESSKVWVSMYEDGQCGDLPARANKLKEFKLLRPAAVKVRRGKVKFTRRGERLQPGHYKVENSKVVPHVSKNIKPPTWE